MLKLDNKFINNFKDILAVGHGAKQRATYLGIAEAYVERLLTVEGFQLEGYNKPEFKLRNEKFLDEVGELFIIDRDLLRASIEKVWKFRELQFSKTAYSKRLRSVVLYNSFYEFLGVSEAFSSEDILDINREIVAYRNAITTTIAYLENNK